MNLLWLAAFVITVLLLLRAAASSAPCGDSGDSGPGCACAPRISAKCRCGEMEPWKEERKRERRERGCGTREKVKSSLENSLGNYCLRKEEEERKRKKRNGGG